MKKIETTNIAGAAKAPYIKATHDHYNESIAGVTSEIVKSLIGTYTTNDVIILRGCEVTATIPGTSSVTAGAIYYNGEIYEVDANASISTPSNTLVWSIATTYRAGDPFAWSDGTSRNLHRIDKFQLTNAVSGTGLADYNGATVKYLKRTATANTSYTAFSTSNCTLSNAQYNLVKQGDLVIMSFFATIVVTTGASNAQVIFNTISNVDFIASSQMIGTFHVRNDSAGSHIAQRMISNGLNTTDLSIDSNKRVKLDLTGGSVSNGQTVNFVVQFTAKTTV